MNRTLHLQYFKITIPVRLIEEHDSQSPIFFQWQTLSTHPSSCVLERPEEGHDSWGIFLPWKWFVPCLLGCMKTQSMKIREVIMFFPSKYPEDKVLRPSKETETESKPSEPASAEGTKPSQVMLVRKGDASATVRQQAVSCTCRQIIQMSALFFVCLKFLY